jgi:DNA-binding MarR family transcriptional regulator
MKKNTSRALTHDLFQLMKLFPHDLFQLMKLIPHPKLKQNSKDGLTRSEYELLVMLVMNLDSDKKALTVTEISSLLQITPAGVTHLINPLEQAGYIERLRAPNDRRIVLIGITHKGIEAAQALILEVQEQLIGLVNHLGEEDSKTLIHLMSRAIEFFTYQFEIKTTPG